MDEPMTEAREVGVGDGAAVGWPAGRLLNPSHVAAQGLPRMGPRAWRWGGGGGAATSWTVSAVERSGRRRRWWRRRKLWQPAGDVEEE